MTEEVAPMSSSKSSADAEQHTLSARGVLATTPCRTDLKELGEGFSSPYDPITNPDGYLILLCSESKLMMRELLAKFHEISSKELLPEWSTGYGMMAGHCSMRKGYASMMENSGWSGVPIDPDAIAFQAGCAVLVDCLSWCLADDRDVCIIPGPIYPAFYQDFKARAKVTLHVMALEEEKKYLPTREDLEKAYTKCVKNGTQPRLFLICQPVNPTGAIYPYDTMKLMIDWCLEKGLHVISDEIYANSIFPGETMISAAHIMFNKLSDEEKKGSSKDYLGNFVHIIHGLSKDFGLAGVRVGALLSHNKELHKAVESLGIFQCVSGPTQSLVASMMADEQWVNWFVIEHKVRIKRCYDAMVDALSVCDLVKIFPAQGTLFAWCDFSAYLANQPNATWEDEQTLWKELFHEYKVLFTTGQSCAATKPGMFRICYCFPTIVSDRVVDNSTDNSTEVDNSTEGMEVDVGVAMRELKSRLNRWVATKKSGDCTIV